MLFILSEFCGNLHFILQRCYDAAEQLITLFLIQRNPPFYHFQLEQKNEGIKFQRIDADVTDALKSKTSKKAEKEMEEQAESISKLYSMPGMDMSAFGGEGETLILNASHPLVQYITEHQDGENAEMICEQLYDLAKLQHAPLSADAMTKFVARSNDIMMLLTK